MPLSPGTRLGPYEIIALIGQGGMGEVYRARDPRLNREVAIKTSREQFNDRFQREARAVAALKHANICHLYDVGPNYLVMELVEGPTLEKYGPLPLDEALRIAAQLAAALEAAHEKNIVHRDLKPANIKLTPEGVVKVLDFGLARIDLPDSGDPGDSPTLMGSPTILGTILGTAAYMSPEQARGKVADKRADIWAFGVVLYELLTGKRLFEGDTVSDILAGVLKEQPDLTAVPPQVRRLLTRCLQKDPKKRLRDIGDYTELLDAEPAPPPTPLPLPTPVLSRGALWARKGAVAVAVVFALLLAALAFIHFRESRPDAPLLDLSVPLPDTVGTVGFLELSPNGRMLLLGAFTRDKAGLWLRSIDSGKLEQLAGTESARAPFWSPDSRTIGFFANGKLKTVSANGGPAQELCEGTGTGRGGAWSDKGTILFASDGGLLRRVDAAGGPCAVVPGAVSGTQRLHPTFLPDGNHFLYVATGGTSAGIYVASLDAPAGMRLLPDVSGVSFVPDSPKSRTGHLLFRRGTALMAQPFDSGTLHLTGEITRVTEDVSVSLSAPQLLLSAAENGLLVYATGRDQESRMTWFDRSGKAVGTPGQLVDQTSVTISPDGGRVAVARRVGGADRDIWLRDIARDLETRFTGPPLGGASPVWSPDGKLIAFNAGNDLYRKDASGGGKEELLWKSANLLRPSDWSRDGRFLLYTEVNPASRGDIWVLPNPSGSASESKPFPFLQTEFNESMAQFSPDGRWVAYTSDESGFPEVYVRPFPSGAGKWRVSGSRGWQPRWRQDGKELFYLQPDSFDRMKFMVAKIASGPGGGFESGVSALLFEQSLRTIIPEANSFAYAVSGDGQRILALTIPEVPEVIHVVYNWQKLLEGTKK